MCFRLGVPPPLMRGAVRLRTCVLHGREQALPDDRGYHSVHCGRQTPHIMQSSVEDAYAYVAQSAGVRVKIEGAVFAGRNSRMDLVLAAPAAATQKVMVDVTIGTAMGNREYAGTPRDGFHRETGWWRVAGSAAARAEAGKHESTWTWCGRRGRLDSRGPAWRTSGHLERVHLEKKS